VVGNALVATAWDLQQGATVIQIDLTSGRATRLARFVPAPRLLYYLHGSGADTAWVDELERDNVYTSTLHIVTGADKKETVVPGEGYAYRQLDFREGVAAWNGPYNQVYGLYGYDVQTGQKFMIDQEKPGHFPEFPHVCNKEWLIYLLSPNREPAFVSELLAYNRLTGEKISVGKVGISLNNPYYDQHHACNGTRIVWLEEHFEKGPVSEVHLFDLTTRSPEVTMSISDTVGTVRIRNEIILAQSFRNIGYDLRKQVKFDANVDVLPSRGTGTQVLLGDDQLVWVLEPKKGQPISFLTTPIIRQ
jgi:hypothetical protein